MSTNQFDCLSNALLRAGLRCELLVAYAIPEHVRDLVAEADIEVSKVRAVTLQQTPRRKSNIVDYKLEVFVQGGFMTAEFQATGRRIEQDTYVLYDRARDGLMKHLHLQH
jgi:hypothetical protein